MSVLRARRSLLFEDRTQKPAPRSAEIDWGHPLANGLISYILLGEDGGPPVDIARRVSGTIPSHYTRSATQLGRGVTIGSGTTAMAFPMTDAPFLGALSVVCSSRPDGATLQMLSKSTTPGDSAQVPLLFQYADSSGMRLYAIRANSGFRAWGSPTGVLTAGSVYTVGGTFTAEISTAPLFYVNGQVQSAATDLFGGSGSGAPTGVSADLSIGTRTTAQTGVIYWLAVYDRVISAAEMLWLHCEPYALLRPAVRRKRPRAEYDLDIVGPNYPEVVTDGGGSEPWSGPPSIPNALDDVTYLNSSGSEFSNQLIFTEAGLNIESSKSIVGILIELCHARCGEGSGVTPIIVRLQKTNAQGPRVPNRTATSPDDWPAFHDLTYGGPLDSWGEPYTPEELNSGEFGFSVGWEQAGGVFEFDAARITVYTTTNVLPLLAYAAGTHAFGPIAIPVDKTKIALFIDVVDHTVEEVNWNVNVQISYNAGADWDEFASFSRGDGATVADKSGVNSVRSSMIKDLPDDTNPDRQFKGTIEIADGTLTTSIGVFFD